jgi:type I restriction enzyme S subunit
MASEVRPFGELFAEQPRNGLTRPKAIRGAGVKMVNMGELFSYPRLRDTPMDRVPLNDSEANRFLLIEGDLLFARQSLVLEGAGKCSIFLKDKEPVTFESHVTRVRLSKNKADPQYYFYYFQSHHGRAAIRSIVEQGAGASGIRGSDLKMLDVLWRPVHEQRAIAHILGTLDDKIELNRRMNETLEAMARALFKSWFVDFDPVRAKAECRWKRGQTLPGLPAQFIDLFPDSFVDSELGEIPKGWDVAPLPDAIEVNPTCQLRKGDVAPYLDMANMPTRGHTPDEVIERAFGSGMRFTNGDTLVARITPCLENGKTAYVDFLENEQVGWGSTEYIVLRPKPPLPSEFAYCMARSNEFREFAIQSMTGSSGRQRVPAESLSHYLVVTPGKEIAKRFGQAVRPLFSRASNAAGESRALAALRDTLLPTLISGELRVKDAERVVREAV